MNELVVIAEAEEMKLVKELGYDKLPILITGVGALNVISALKDIPKNTHIINIGYAGSKDIEPGNFYYVERTTLYHPNVDYSEPEYPTIYDWQYKEKKCYTGCDFVLQSDISDCLFDMEVSYICALGFNVTSIKYVSDNLDLQEYRKKLNE